MRFLSLLLLPLLFLSCTSGNHNTTTQTAVNYDTRIEELGIKLPEIPEPSGSFTHVVRTGNLLFLSGKVSRKPNGEPLIGKVGGEVTLEEAKIAAREIAITQLAVIKQELGTLNKVKQVVKVLGMVNSLPDFGGQPEVINGFSDLMIEVFGERGKHARSAVGVGSLPRNYAVEIELIVEVATDN